MTGAARGRAARRAGVDSLIAWIEGERNGRTRRVEFPFRRVRCGEP